MRNGYVDNMVSIIVPIYNAGRYIEKTLVSVLNQTYKEYEIVLIDDCSTDDSREIIEKYMRNDRRIVYSKLLQNSGAAIARNKGLELAKGRYIAFLDSDDTWEPTKLEKQVYQMRKTGCAFSYTRYDLVNESNEIIKGKVYLKMQASYKELLTKTVIATPTVMIDRELTGEVYMPNRRTGQDYAFWLLLLRKFNAYGIDEVLVHVCRRSNSLSKNKLQNIRDVWEVQTVNEEIGKFRAGCNVFRYCLYALRKHFF